MRRHFILEMVFARRAAENAMEQKVETEKAAARAKADLEAAITEKKQAENRALAAEAANKENQEKLAALESQSGGIKEDVGNGTRPLVQDTKILTKVLDNAKALLPSDSPALATLAALRQQVAAAQPVPDDPWRGLIGQTGDTHGFSLSASVLGTADPNLFQIDILVKAITASRIGQVAGRESVIFFVPPSFAEDPYKSTFDANGEAKLQLFASAVFTVGALMEDGTTIEYNLAGAEGVDKAPRFLQR